jgi:3,4-dihydroxy 2-butanone 4-phosphate synthase/GTP cyclohydrolase II
LALTKGVWTSNETILTRIHSSRITNDILGMLTGSIHEGLDDIFNLINNNKKGSILFINKNENSEDLLSRISELEKMQSKGEIDIPPPIIMDVKDFGIGAQILHDLKIKKLNVISNSKQKRRVGLTGYGLTIKGYTNY